MDEGSVLSEKDAELPLHLPSCLAPEDGEYVAACAEFPSLSWLAESEAEALQGIMELVAATIADIHARARRAHRRMNAKPAAAS